MEWWRWHIARETGWTLEYIDALSVKDFHEYLQITDGENKADSERRQKSSKR
jgi:hypothetical protein